MELANGLFARAVDYLYKEGYVSDQKELSEKTGITETTISRILNDKVKKPSEETLRRLNAAFGNIFNPEYFRGENAYMLLSDYVEAKREAEHKLKETESAYIDQGSVVNSIIAAYDEAIESYKLQIEQAKRMQQLEIIRLESRITDLERLIQSKDEYIDSLKQKLLSTQKNPPIYPYGVAEKPTQNP